jgi:hypothetical protein
VVEGANASTILLRRTKQAIAEFFRIQIKEDCWKGLIEHTMDGWNIGLAPYGYLADRVPHSVPAKAAQGRTKTRLIPDPARAAVVTLIFAWRVTGRLSVPTIAWRLNRDLAAYPPPGVDRDQHGRDLAEPEVHRAHGLRPDPQGPRQQEVPARPAAGVDLVGGAQAHASY